MKKYLPLYFFLSLSLFLGLAYYTFTLFGSAESPKKIDLGEKISNKALDKITENPNLSSQDKLKKLIKTKFKSSLLENRRKYLISRLANSLGEPVISYIYSYDIDYNYLSRFSKKILLDYAAKVGDESAIVNTLEKLIEVLPNEPEFKYMLAKSYLRQSLKENATKLFTEVQNKYPDSEYALGADYYLANLSEDPEIRNEKLVKYIQKSPNANLAALAVEEMAGIEALKQYRNDIALVYYHLENYEKAIEYFDSSAVDFTDKFYLPYARTLAKNKQYDLAKAFLIDKLKLTESLAVSQQLLEALKTLDESTNLLPGFKEIYAVAKANQDELLWSIAEATKLKTDYEELFQKYPDSNYAAESMARVFWLDYKRKAYHLAEKTYQEHWQKFPNAKSHSFVAFWMGKIHLERNSNDEARRVFNNLIVAHPLDYYAFRAKDILDTNKLSKEKWYLLPSKSSIVHLSSWKMPELFTEAKLREQYGNEMAELYITKSFDHIEAEALRHPETFDKKFLAGASSLAGDTLKSITLAQELVKDLSDLNDSEVHQLYQVAYPLLYADLIGDSLPAESILDPFMVHALIKQESTYQLNTVSPVGAVGLMQIMPFTANDVARVLKLPKPNPEDLFKPELNIKLGVQFMEEVFRKFNRNMIYSVASYNAGPQRVSTWSLSPNAADPDLFVEEIPFSETKNYVKRVLTNYWIYRALYI
jgi:soluble lytic murein transglycosylase